MQNESLEIKGSSMRKGLLEFCILLTVSKGRVYSSDILSQLKTAQLLVVEGTLYPLLSRLKTQELLEYDWEESRSGPPRKYYEITKKGQGVLDHLKKTWGELSDSITSLTH